MLRRLLAVFFVGWVVSAGATEAHAAVSSLFMHGGRTRSFTDADGTFLADRNFHNGVSVRFFTGVGGIFWSLDFAGPDRTPLVVGAYEGATRFPFQEPGHPGLDVSGEGFGCNTLTGRFDVIEVIYGPGDTITSFWAVFEQNCGSPVSTFGEIRFNADVGVVVKAPAQVSVRRTENLTFDVFVPDPNVGLVALAAVNLPSGATFTDHGDNTGTFDWTPGLDQIGEYDVTFRGDDGHGQTNEATTHIRVKGATSLRLRGEPENFTVGNRRLFFTPADGTFTAFRNNENGVSLDFTPPRPQDESWSLDFRAPNNEPLTARIYTGARRFRQPTEPALSLARNGLACVVTGSFEVKEIAYGPGTEITAFWATFEAHCGDTAPKAVGEIRFNADSVDLTIAKAGTGQGTVSSASPTIACGDDCTAGYRRGDRPVLTAAGSSAAHSIFSGWSGGGCSGIGACTVTVDTDTVVTAAFDVVPFFTVTVVRAGSGGGRVRSDVPGVDCGASCSAEYAIGTTVVLTPTPEPGSSFAGWTGPCSGIGACTVEMTEARLVTATFDLIPTFVLTVARDGTGAGRVRSDVPGIDCGASCSGTFFTGTTVVLTATPDPGFGFAGWTAPCAGTGGCAMVMTEARAVTATFVRLADLGVTAVSAPASVRTGQSLAITSTVTNRGFASAGAFAVSFHLSATSPTPGGGVTIGRRTISGLDPGAASTATTSVIIPVGFDPRTYFLSAMVVPGGGVGDADETNNGRTAADTVTVVMHRPDLSMTALAAAATVRTGQPLAITNAVKNSGPAAAPAFRITFFLSGEGTPGPGVEIGGRMVGGLAAGATSSAVTPITIPLTFAPGTYVLSAVVDGAGAAVESNETNNTLTATATVTVVRFQPDLTVTAVSAPATGRTGQPLAVTSTVKNVGDAPAPAFRVTFYMSSTDRAPGAGVEIGSRTLTGLGAGGTSTVTTPVTIPLGLAPGPYILSAVADSAGAVVEVDKSNNGFTAQDMVTVVLFRADLAMTALSAPGTARTGEPLAVNSTVKNNGQAPAPAFRVTFFLSAMDNAPGAGVAIGFRTVAGLAAGASSAAMTPVKIPIDLEPRTYFLSAVADPADTLVEVDDTNNGLTAQATVTVLMNRPDLVMTTVSVPATGRTGQPLAVTNTVQNIGQSAAPAFRITFYMSATDPAPGAGVAVGSRTVSGLARDASSSATTMVTIPLGLDAGSYFVSAVADDPPSVVEVSETNNGRTAPDRVSVALFRADLMVTKLTVPAAGQMGRPLAVTSTVKNVGPAAASAFRVTFFMSATDGAPGAGVPVGFRSVASLAPGATSTAITTVTVPLSFDVGTYFVSAVADDANVLPEVNDTNNGFTAPTLVTISLFRPDLAITNLAVPSTGVGLAGRPLAATATVKNVGPAPAGAFRVSFYLSEDAAFDGTDVFLGAQTVAGLAANASLTTTVRPVIPPTTFSGNYFLLVIVDDFEKVVELTESNNTRPPVALAVVPFMVGAFPEQVTVTTFCTNPAFDTSDSGPATLRITTQDGTAFSGGLSFSQVVQGVVVTSSFTFHGDVDVTSRFNGFFTVTGASGGSQVLAGGGGFEGATFDRQFSAHASGSIFIVTGDSCSLEVSIVPR